MNILHYLHIHSPSDIVPFRWEFLELAYTLYTGMQSVGNPFGLDIST